MAMQWQMGEQPEWISVEEKGDVPAGLLKELLDEPVWLSLEKRGYAVLPSSSNVQGCAKDMDLALRAFCTQPLAEKARFVSMMNGEKFSPNEYHGYAEVQNLKEQFMVRVGGPGTGLRYPGSYPQPGSPSIHFGLASVALFQHMDQLSRRCLAAVVDHQGLSGDILKRILDPVINPEATPYRETPPTPNDSRESISSQYNVDGYVTSSLLDMFRYYNKADGAGTKEVSEVTKDTQPKRYMNNHLSHTDSGILTAVLSSALPGLEVYDQLLKKWISLEKVIHSQSGEGPSVFAKYVSVFWGDSCVYLSPKRTTPTLHRVAGCECDADRYAYVYKMRTQPEATAPRYQEDYALAELQHRAMESARKSGKVP